jgi:hypothetical protein
MQNFKENKEYLISQGVYKNAIHTDYTNQTIYITIPYGSLKNSGKTKVYKIPHKLNLKRIVDFWSSSVNINKTYTY